MTLNEMERVEYTPANLKALRTKYGLTQRRIAEMLSVNIATVQRWETPVTCKSYKPMPHARWLVFLQILTKQPLLYRDNAQTRDDTDLE